MGISLDSFPVTIDCGGCGKELTETIGRLKVNPDITCPTCGHVMTMGLDEVISTEKRMNDDLRNMGISGDDDGE